MILLAVLPVSTGLHHLVRRCLGGRTSETNILRSVELDDQSDPQYITNI